MRDGQGHAFRATIITAVSGLVVLLVIFAGLSVSGAQRGPTQGVRATTPAQSTSFAPTSVLPSSPREDSRLADQPVVEPHAGNVFVVALESLVLDDSPDSHAGYNRSLFHVWVDVDGNGCNTRAEVLIVESLVPTTHRKTCTIETGQWISLYDGVVITNATKLDIDHVVPLSEAWKSGAWRWSDSTRKRFANDLDYPDSLVAVTSRSNQSKGDKDPAHWLPVAAATCVYSQRWVAVKYRWSLTVDTAERAALEAILENCPPDAVQLPDKATIDLGR